MNVAVGMIPDGCLKFRQRKMYPLERMMKFLLSILFSISVFAADPKQDVKLNGKEIMQKSEEATRLSQFTAKAVLKSTKKTGEEKSKSFQFWRKLKADGARYQSLTRFSAPAEVKGEAILFLENETGANDILLYLPAYQKTRRIERTQQSSSFMGSDFSYSDLTIPHANDYKYILNKEEVCPGAPSKICFRIEGEPATDIVRDQTGYSKMTIWVKKESFTSVRVENYDLTGAFLKSINFSEEEKLSGGKWFHKKIEVENKKDGGKTILQFSELKTEEKIPDSLFTQQALGKGSR